LSDSPKGPISSSDRSIANEYDTRPPTDRTLIHPSKPDRDAPFTDFGLKGETLLERAQAPWERTNLGGIGPAGHTERHELPETPSYDGGVHKTNAEQAAEEQKRSAREIGKFYRRQREQQQRDSDYAEHAQVMKAQERQYGVDGHPNSWTQREAKLQSHATVVAHDRQVQEKVSANTQRWPNINAIGRPQDVTDAMRYLYERDRKYYSYEEVADAVERDISDKYEKLAKSRGGR
jgi:hypothetical protein